MADNQNKSEQFTPSEQQGSDSQSPTEQQTDGPQPPSIQQKSEQPRSEQHSSGQPSGSEQPAFNLFGENGRWLWFAGGVVLALIGVIFAALFNMNRPTEIRNEAVKYAVWGMLLGAVLELIMFSSLFGLDAILGTGAASSSSGSIF